MKKMLEILWLSAVVFTGICAVLVYIAFWLQFPENSGWGIILLFSAIGGGIWAAERSPK